jgi:endonuclease/exonuclease/phosphatase family metal-dependent hydrolase
MSNRARAQFADILRWGRGRSDLVTMLFSALTIVFLLEAYRVFASYMVFEIDQSNRVELARNTIVIFGLTALPAWLASLAGLRRLWIYSLAIAVFARVVLQIWEDPAARWQLAALTLVATVWLMIILLPMAPEAVSYGIGLGFLLDLAIRGARETLDLPWSAGPVQDIVTLGVAGSLVLFARLMYPSQSWNSSEGSFQEHVGLLGLGSGIGLWLLAGGNLGFAEVRAETELDNAFWLQAAGTLIAIFMVVFPTDLGRHLTFSFGWPRPQVLMLSVILVLAIVSWSEVSAHWLNELFVLLFALGTTRLTVATVRSVDFPEYRGRSRTALTITLGLLLQAAIVFGYFASSGQLWLLIPMTIVLALGALAGGEAFRRPAVLQRQFALPAIASVALAAGVWLWIGSDSVQPVTYATTGSNLTVMTYNIQEGFSRENRWSLENTARTIEDAEVDVVILQEVTRGWLVMSSVDQIRWLAERLDMTYVFAGNSHDGMWGNAILTRLPVLATESIVYSTTDNLRRGAVAAELETATGSVWVIGTHLDNPAEADEVRQAQTDELLGFWGGKVQTIIGGDFNATSDSRVWQMLASAGFHDTASDLGPDATTSENGRRIDYLFVTPDFGVVRTEIPDVWTSDHKPVVSEIRFAD